MNLTNTKFLMDLKSTYGSERSLCLGDRFVFWAESEFKSSGFELKENIWFGSFDYKVFVDVYKMIPLAVRFFSL